MVDRELPLASPPDPLRCDAAVVGGGLAGLAAAIHLRRAGLRVVCLEPEPFPHDRVGESLDWSSPSLLAEIGLTSEALLGAGVATAKHNIRVVALGRPVSMGSPPGWWDAPPLRFEKVTLHVDRPAMDGRLFAQAEELGVEFLWERAREVVADGERVIALETASGRRIEAAWFIDAGGRNACLFARHFGVKRIDYGRPKVSLWCTLETPCSNEGTTFYLEAPREDYLSWVWEIPIRPDRSSIGCVLEAAVVREERRRGRTPGEILHDRLVRFPRFLPLLAGEGGTAEPSRLDVRATAYRSFVHANACGPNWLMMGEAAALHDALTGNGVTAAFRHAADGTRLILAALERGHLTPRQRRVYDANVRRMGRMFNHSIETAVYDWPIRNGLGVTAAQVIYTSCAFILNALYTRFRPGGRPSMLVFGALMQAARVWIDGWTLLGRLVATLRRSRAVPRGRPAEAT